MAGIHSPKTKIVVIRAGSPIGGIVEITVSGDRKDYYRRFSQSGSYQRIPMYRARQAVEQAERDCLDVPDRLYTLDQQLVQDLKNRTEGVETPPRAERSTNWSRQIVGQ